MNRIQGFFALAVLGAVVSAGTAQQGSETRTWPQWRGPTRDGVVGTGKLPSSLKGDAIQASWRVKLGPSYSGPIVSDRLVYTTETVDRKVERVRAFDRQTGKQVWETSWKGALRVPFFAAANGSWIRSTPAFDGKHLYVAGMRDYLVCLDAKTGKQVWQVDFVKEFSSPLPSFGFVCSPLLDEDALYVQAGAALVKLRKDTGKVLWRTLRDGGGAYGSAFSSPIFATLAGKRQLVVQTRKKLVGVDLKEGKELWSIAVPAFRGMNILTPLISGKDRVFTSAYGGKSIQHQITAKDGAFSVAPQWEDSATAYMSTPVIVDGDVYLLMRNQRITCIDLTTGKRRWTSSKRFGKYWSMVTDGKHILALDQRGILYVVKPNRTQLEIVDSKEISKAETWAHLAISGKELFIRELNAIVAYRLK